MRIQMVFFADGTGESYVVFGSATGTSNIQLSSLNGTNGFKIAGINTVDGSGFSVSIAGDINGDGYDDLLVGAINADPNNIKDAGETYLIFGKPSGFSSTLNLSSIDGTNGFILNGASSNDSSGYSVSTAGDINGDGFDDIIIGAKFGDAGGSNSGETYVLFGQDFTGQVDFLGTSGNDTLSGTGSDEILIGGLGDDIIDGGAGDDIIIGGAGNDTIIYDPATDTIKVDGGGGDDTLEITGSGISLDLTTLNQTENYNLYRNFEEIDITGSGNNTIILDDIDIAKITDEGNTLRIDGDSADTVSLTGGWSLNGSISFAGEFYTEYQQNNSRIQINNQIDRSGITLTLSLKDLNGSNGFVLEGESLSLTGRSVSSAGDINGDGFADIIVSAPYATSGEKSFVVFGSSSAFDSTIDLASLDGITGFSFSGRDSRSVSSAGDVNNDGFDDIIIGDKSAGISSAGESYVFFGKASGYTPSIDLSGLNGTNGFVLTGNDPNDFSGYSVSTAGDVNGDGIDDVIVGAPRAQITTFGQGESYVVYGKTSGFSTSIDLLSLNASQGFSIIGIDNVDYSGRSVSNAGDVNGDGYDDLIIGAPNADVGGFGSSDPGDAYLIFGGNNLSTINITSLNGTNGFRIPGIGSNDYAGRSVSNAGDINGDGFADIIVGAPYNTTTTGNPGESYVIFGKDTAFSSTFNPATLNGSNGFRIDGITASDSFGYSVSSAGDFNGDGIDDLLVGALNADPNSMNRAGEAYVIFGKTSAFSSTLSASSLDGSNGFIIEGLDAGDLTGRSVSDAGDINGDGFDDLIIGAPNATPNGNQSGESYVIFGKDFTFAVDLPGSDGNDNLNGTGSDEVLHGGLGDDTLDGAGGNDVLKGAAGDDILVYDSADVLKIDGGTGLDTLLFNGSGESLDLTNISNLRYEGIEKLDLTGTGNNTLSLNIHDVLDLPDKSNVFLNDNTKQILILGNAGDTVNSTGQGWVAGTNVSIDGNIVTPYTHNDIAAQILIDTDITQNIS